MEANFSQESIQKNIQRLTNQIWKLIPMRENNEEWLVQLDTVIIDLAGLSDIFYTNPAFLQALMKLKGLKQEIEIDFFIYRKTIFEVISLIQGNK